MISSILYKFVNNANKISINDKTIKSFANGEIFPEIINKSK